MKIVLVTQFFSEGMGYTENILPRVMGALGHEVHVVATALQVYGNQSGYQETYGAFLGSAECAVEVKDMGGFTLHRMPYYKREMYVGIKGLAEKLDDLDPDVVQFSQAASLDLFSIMLRPVHYKWMAFTECHQHISVAKCPTALSGIEDFFGYIFFKLTRTLPAYLSHRRVDKCFAIAPDCADVATRLYGVPSEKIVHLPLGTDTELFTPPLNEEDCNARQRIRGELGLSADDVLLVYTGKLSYSKNPLLIVQALDIINLQENKFRAIFIGAGEQSMAIAANGKCKILPMTKHCDLAAYYKAADIGVWPCQESMSMLDAASCGLPLVVSDKMGDLNRVRGNGFTFRHNDATDLVLALSRLASAEVRSAMGQRSREKMVSEYSWKQHCVQRIKYYEVSCALTQLYES